MRHAGRAAWSKARLHDSLVRGRHCRPGRRGGGNIGMALRRMALEIGMGTDIRGGDSTKAAIRALRDALWHNALTIGVAVNQPVDAMQVEVLIGVPRPDDVDKDQVLAILPHGTGTVTVVDGGLEIPNDNGTGTTLMANCCAIVRLDIEDAAPCR